MRQFLKGFLGARKSILAVKLLVLGGKPYPTLCDRGL